MSEGKLIHDITGELLIQKQLLIFLSEKFSIFEIQSTSGERVCDTELLPTSWHPRLRKEKEEEEEEEEEDSPVVRALKLELLPTSWHPRLRKEIEEEEEEEEEDSPVVRALKLNSDTSWRGTIR
jgi:hypothetical protein